MPVPPSTNSLFATRKAPKKGRSRQFGRVTTARYAAWQEAAGWAAKQQLTDARLAEGWPTRIAGPFAVLIIVSRPSGRADLDNFIKAPVDLLVSLNVVDDDRDMMEVRICWGAVNGCVVEVRPFP